MINLKGETDSTNILWRRGVVGVDEHETVVVGFISFCGKDAGEWRGRSFGKHFVNEIVVNAALPGF